MIWLARPRFARTPWPPVPASCFRKKAAGTSQIKASLWKSSPPIESKNSQDVPRVRLRTFCRMLTRLPGTRSTSTHPSLQVPIFYLQPQSPKLVFFYLATACGEHAQRCGAPDNHSHTESSRLLMRGHTNLCVPNGIPLAGHTNLCVPDGTIENHTPRLMSRGREPKKKRQAWATGIHKGRTGLVRSVARILEIERESGVGMLLGEGEEEENIG